MKHTVLLFFVFISFVISAQQKIKVACVGDIVSYGASDESENSYPVLLQLMVGEGYEVRDFGLAGGTMLRKGDLSYWQERSYKDLLAWNPDVIIIKLGTHDSKPQNWIYGEEFEGDYRAFVQSFKKLSGSHKIFICTPVPVFKELEGIEAGIVTDEIVPSVKNVAMAEKVSLIDLYTSLAGKPELFPDGVHPNAAGEKLIAENVFNVIKP
jgi:acyl-CoA thioesterase I